MTLPGALLDKMEYNQIDTEVNYMHAVKVDLTKNRLYITLDGFNTPEEARKIADEVIEKAKTLRPGFFAINDIRTFKAGTPDSAEQIKRASEFLMGKGMRHLIRVTGESRIASMQVDRMAKEAGYIAEIASTVEEAEKILDQWEKVHGKLVAR